LGVDGKEKHALSLPDQFSTIELGRHKTKGVRLLAHVNWGREVVVIDASGKVLWKYSGSMGINGAHWGDLDGDGTDEMIIGMNGFGGLHAVSADGKQLWSSASFGNIWNQAVIPAENNRPALVFATEAGGSIQVLDAKGNRLRSLRPRGKYSTMMTAASMDSSNTVQIIAHGQDQTLVCDENGRVAFAAPAKTGTTQWQNPTFGSGDVNGDGVREWCFVDASGALVLATVEGKKLGALPAGPIQGFTVVPVREGRALVVVLQGGNLKAYSFQ
jgi:hypothetical protein